MNINLFEDHFGYITKFKSYARKFQCRLCEKLFDSKCNLLRHERTCETATKLRFPMNYYNNQWCCLLSRYNTFIYVLCFVECLYVINRV